MPGFNTHSNHSYSTVLTAPSPATSGTSLVVQSGDGVKFNTGWAWVWPPSVQPTVANAEVVNITVIATDTLTITRTQQGSTNQSIAVTWQIAQGLTKRDIEQIENAINYAADAGSTDSYAVTLAPVPTAYTTGQAVLFKANTANTGAATLNVNGLGAKTIKKYGSTDLATRDIVATQIVLVVYDGTNFQMLSPYSSVTVIRQDDTTNSTKNNSVILTGWGYKLGDASTAMSESVTFGLTFSAAPIVLISSAGQLSGANPTLISDLNAQPGYVSCDTSSISVTAFTAGLSRNETGAGGAQSFGNTVRFGYAWIAVGEL